MSETLQQWAEHSLPVCKECGHSHDDAPHRQHLYHAVNLCDWCGNTHRLVDFHPPATPEKLAEIELFNARYAVIEAACEELRQSMWAEFEVEVWPALLEEKP